MKLARHFALIAATVGMHSTMAVAAGVFAGFDDNVSSVIPFDHPNSDVARTEFLSALGGSTVQQLDFETLAAGAVPATLTFSGGLQAAFVNFATDGSTIESGLATVGGNGPQFGGFPISGSKSLGSTTNPGESFWSMTFSQPVTAVGFYMTDPSDWITHAGPLTPIQISVSGTNGSAVYSLLPSDADAATVSSASVGFFGIVDQSGILGITVLNPASIPGRDGVAFDDFLAVAAVPEPQTWLTMLAGLGLLGARLKRRVAAR